MVQSSVITIIRILNYFSDFMHIFQTTIKCPPSSKREQLTEQSTFFSVHEHVTIFEARVKREKKDRWESRSTHLLLS